ncbi:hypothetical protein [Candidatus Uabimicrobium sp. HlEnr_7]|uniref:hypothetical protein n=1 Tax=Candidatus Uabimicrobium helgolandensis TaxID=3095367 RepID=UPI00355814C9
MLFFQNQVKSIAIIILLISFLYADEVVLKNKKIHVGKIISKTNKVIIIKNQAGLIITIDRRNIKRILKRKTPQQEFRERYKSIDKNDQQELKKLAQWASKHKYLSSEYSSVMTRIKTLKYKAAKEIFNNKYHQIDPTNEQQLKELVRWTRKQDNLPKEYKKILFKFNQLQFKNLETTAGKNVEKLYELYAWKKRRNYSGASKEEILSKVLAIDPEHTMARYSLNQRKYNGKWLPEYEVKELKKRDFSVKMREKGFIFYKNEWMKADEIDFIAEVDALKNKLSIEEEKNTQLQTEKIDLSDKISKQESTIQQLSLQVENKNQEHQKQINNIQQEKQDLQNSLVSIEEEKNTLLNNLQRDISNIETQIKKIKKEILNLEISQSIKNRINRIISKTLKDLKRLPK